MKKIISTDKAPAAIGPYSQAVEVNGLDKASEENGAIYQKSEDNNAIFTGASKSGNFTIYADSKTGIIKKIEIPEINFTANLTDIKAI